MASNKNLNQKQSGEKELGKDHYNPGNQAGKTVKIGEVVSEQKNDVDQRETRREEQDKKR